jgi:hypothetical protein
VDKITMARPVDLYAEMLAAARAVGARDRQRLRDAYGIDDRERRRLGGVGIARVHWQKNGLYRPDPDGGEPAVILPVWEPGGLVDLVAWQPWHEHRMARRVGFAVSLGALYASRFNERCIRLWRSPARWAAAECDGAVILNWRDATPELLGFDLIVAEDFELGCEAKKHVTRALQAIARTPTVGVMHHA